MRPRNFASLSTFIGVFPRRMLGSGKKPYCWWKWIHTVLEVENLKPLSDTHFWTLFTHRCIPLSTLFNVFQFTHKAKSSTNKEQSVPFKTALTMLLILMLKRAGDKMLPCGTPISCLCSSERVEPTLKPVLNWANVCSPEHTSDTSTNYDSFLNWTFSSPNMVRTVQTLLHSQMACNEMQASARTCGRRAADSMMEM